MAGLYDPDDLKDRTLTLTQTPALRATKTLTMPPCHRQDQKSFQKLTQLISLNPHGNPWPQAPSPNPSPPSPTPHLTAPPPLSGHSRMASPPISPHLQAAAHVPVRHAQCERCCGGPPIAAP